ncbi:MAG: tetratricopeptide repeat protein [bacterium]
MKFNALPGMVALILVSSLFGQSASKKVAEANKLFEEQKYDEANNKYRDALIENPDSPIIHFNIGDVQYKKRNYEEALNSYTKALASDDILLQSQAHYNLGNTLYRLGKLPESILEYKRALDLNPSDEDAKYNLEYVRAKLKDNAQQQQQNEDQEQDPIKPTEYAKELLKKAKVLVAKREYVAAKKLLDDGLKADRTVAAFQDFMKRLGDVIEIQGSE